MFLIYFDTLICRSIYDHIVGALGVLKSLKRESASLVKAITRETLHASHQVLSYDPM